MQLGDVYLITKRVNRVSSRSVDALEKLLGTCLPCGYREYLGSLGVGRFSGFLNVYHPQQVKNQLKDWRESLADVIVDGMAVGKYRRGVLTADKVREAFLVGDTCNGDQFVATASCGEALFVIPHDSPNIHRLPRGFLDPMACCRAVKIEDASPWFEADNARRQLKNFSVRGGAPVVEQALTELWGESEIRRFGKYEVASWGSVVSFGVRAIEGLVKIYGRPRGGHTVTLSYDKAFAGEIRAFNKAIASKSSK